LTLEGASGIPGASPIPAPQVDLYGSTEAGYLFVGEAFKYDSRVIDANAFIELAPWRAAHPDIFQIYVTTRDRAGGERKIRAVEASGPSELIWGGAPGHNSRCPLRQTGITDYRSGRRRDTSPHPKAPGLRFWWF